MKKLIICLSCVWWGISAVYAQENLTLQQAISMGLERNYAIRIAENNRRIAENTNNLGEAGLLPVLDAIAGKNYSIQNVEQRFVSDPENPRIIDNGGSIGTTRSLQANYLLNLGAIYTFQRLGTLSEVSHFEAKVSIENTVAAITSAYYRVVLEEQRYEVLQNTLNFSEERLRISKDRYEMGRASRQEYLAGQVDYNTDYTALINQEEIIANARIQLNRLLAQDPGETFVINDTILVNQDLKLDALISTASLENPQLLAAQRIVNVSHLEMRELQAQRLPEVNLFGDYTRQQSTSDFGFLLSNRSNGFNYGFQVRLNLFNGFIVHNRVQNARIAANSQELNFQQLKLELESDLNEAYNSYRNSIRLLEVAEMNYEVAEENADIALLRYKEGNTSALEFREAQQNALAAESQLINVLFTIKDAEVELQRLSGSVMSGI